MRDDDCGPLLPRRGWDDSDALQAQRARAEDRLRMEEAGAGMVPRDNWVRRALGLLPAPMTMVGVAFVMLAQMGCNVGPVAVYGGPPITPTPRTAVPSPSASPAHQVPVYGGPPPGHGRSPQHPEGSPSRPSPP